MFNTNNNKIFQLKIPDNIISFRIGQPKLSDLPVNLMHKASELFFKKDEVSQYLQYGNMQGAYPFRKKLSGFLSQAYQTPIDLENLLVTAGTTSGIDLLCTILFSEGDSVFVEDPTYFIISQVFKDHKLNIIPIPTDNHGMRIDVLEEKIKNHNAKAVYTIPIFQNPSSITLSEERRKKLCDICYKNKILILADEVYHGLNYKNISILPLFKYDEYSNVISISSFSKILAPGLRLGWIHTLNTNIINKIIDSGILFSGGGLNPFTSGQVQCAIESGLLNNHIQQLKRLYSSRLDILADALDAHLKGYIDFKRPEGGFYIWAKLKNHKSSSKLESISHKYGVSVMPGSKCSVAGSFDNYMRLSISFLNKNEITEGVKCLKSAIESLN